MNMIRLIAVFLGISSFGAAMALSVGDSAPAFELKNQNNETFSLSSRASKWTVLYFYPKSGTPGCTKQACAFRDHLNKIKELGAEVYGISTDSVADQLRFHKDQKLNFVLLADPKGEVAKKYNAIGSILNFAKRWTFVIGPDLKIKHIERDVDPLSDALNVAKKIKELQGSSL